jgi:lipopolysaccharide/colanic/teichoic acid biosynthesis glycosyltransferase
MSIHYGENTIRSATPVPVFKQNQPAPITKDAPSLATAPYRFIGKRLLDLAVCLLAAPFVITVVAILALIVRRDGGKAFYSQNRVGRNGRIYKMWKLRSMVSDADDILQSYLATNPQARAEWDKDQKLKSDPRITKFGQLLRKSSLDELPQLWNVVRGEMSLVGPRPMMPCQKALYPGTNYYNLLPGISGSWQVSDRNTSSFAERATFDAQYDNDLSLREDIRILKATVGVVFKATGY